MDPEDTANISPMINVQLADKQSFPIDENDIEFEYDEENIFKTGTDENGETNVEYKDQNVAKEIEFEPVNENDIGIDIIGTTQGVNLESPNCSDDFDDKEKLGENFSGEKVDDNDHNSSILIQNKQTSSRNDNDDEFDFDENEYQSVIAKQHTNETSKVVEDSSLLTIANCDFKNEQPSIECIDPLTEKIDKCNIKTEGNVETDTDQVDWAKEHAAAAEEWGNVQEIEITAESTRESQNTVVTTLPVSFPEAIEYFQGSDLSEYSDKINSSVQHSGIASIFNFIVGPPPLKKFLHVERDLIFKLACLKFDNDKNLYLRILFTIYKTLTKINVDCPRFGHHWENIGFQGNDPSTDLRGCGMLGLITILHFTKTESTSTLAAKIYHLSQDEVQNFPFCVLSINLTRIAMQVLREGKLNKECNRRYRAASKPTDKTYTGIVYEVFQEFYVALFNQFYQRWKNEYKTMVDSGFIMVEIEAYAKNKPMELLMGQQKQPKKKSKADNDKVENLQGLDEI